jgi:hypothetical protein
MNMFGVPKYTVNSYLSRKYEVTMARNSGTPMLKSFLMKRASSMNFQLLTPLNEMGWLRGRIELLLRWKEPCWMSTRLKTSFGLKLSTRLAMPSTASTFTSFTKRLPMSLSPVKSLRCPTLECLGPKVDKGFLLLAMVLMNMHIKSSI